MLNREQVRAFFAWRSVRTALFVLGLLLMAVITPLIAVFPGPGGIFVFGAGLTLVLKNSDWAKRRYVGFKRWQPKAGRWTDWGLRRQSTRRREALAKEKERRESPPPHCVARTDDPLPSAGVQVAHTDPTPTETAPAPPIGQALKR
jgi:hypothetical protein